MLDRFERWLSYRRPVIVAVHVVLIALAYVGAFLLRFEFAPSSEQWRLFALTLPLLLVIRAGVFAAFHLYRGLWRYVSMQDILAMLRAVTLSSLAFAASVIAAFPGRFPGSILVLDWLLCLALVGGVRLVLRSLRESSRRTLGGRRAIVVGAGDAGEMLVREIERNVLLSYDVVGFVDDDYRMRGRRLHGIEVVGAVDDLPAVCRARKPEVLLVAIPSASGPARRRILERCRETGLPFKTVPAMNDLLQGKARIEQLQEALPKDLLGREAVRLDMDRLQRELRGRRILVTGAAGTIGSELCRQLAMFEPEMIILYDRAESSLYFTDLELKDRFPSVKSVPVVGDILERQHLTEIMQAHGPDLVYHAAAYKHVPLMEDYALEAIVNNIFGTDAVLTTALQNGVKKFVLISTDKAVRPAGIMGMTKRVAEDLLRMNSGTPTTLVAVRFGNVLGSDGSVLPLFQRQIARGGPVTVTDSEASRYFMLPSEAVQLVLQAGAMGQGGEVFFLDMGEPVRIIDLARNLVRLSGLEPDKDIKIEVIGLRPGERLREELVMENEDLCATEHEKVLMARSVAFPRAAFETSLEELRRLISARDREGATRHLRLMAGG